MKTRIALCMEYRLSQQGGTEVLVRSLAENLSDVFDVVLVTDDTPESLATAGLKARLARHIRWEPAKLSRARSRALAGELARERVQLAHFHFGETFAWGNRCPGRCPIHHAARRGIRCLSTVHLVEPPLAGYLGAHRPWWVKLGLFPIAWGAKCYTLSRTDVEFAVSRHDLAILHRCCGPFARKQRLMYHSTLRESESATGTGDRRPVILYVGTLGPRKGQVILLEAFNRVAARFREWRLVLVGRWEEDPYYRQVRALIDGSPHRDRIELRGRIPDDQVRQLMCTSAIFAMPSLEEGLGLSLQEALFFGCPAVGSRAGGIPELIDDGVNGLLVPPGDPQALADGLSNLMADPAKRQALGDQARASVLRKGMTQEKMAQNYIAAYQEVLSLK